MFGEEGHEFLHARRVGDVVPDAPDEEQSDEDAEQQKREIGEPLRGIQEKKLPHESPRAPRLMIGPGRLTLRGATTNSRRTRGSSVDVAVWRRSGRAGSAMGAEAVRPRVLRPPGSRFPARPSSTAVRVGSGVFANGGLTSDGRAAARSSAARRRALTTRARADRARDRGRRLRRRVCTHTARCPRCCIARSRRTGAWPDAAP